MNSDDVEDVGRMLDHARLAYLQWHALAERMICGEDLPATSVEQDDRACEFGRWCEQEGRKRLGARQTFSLVVTAHRALHAVYRQIYDLVREGRSGQARERLPDLIEASGVLMDAIDMLEREVRGMQPG